MTVRQIIEAYRWQRGLGHPTITVPHGRIVANAALPDIWDANHADMVTASRPDEIDAVLAAMERHLAHTRWRVVHTDPLTPEPVSAWLALDGYVEQPAVIQMVLDRTIDAVPIGDIVPVGTEADWAALTALVRRDHLEGARTDGLVSPALSDATIASYRAKTPDYRFHLVRIGGEAVAYGAYAAAPSGAGMIEDLFTLPSHRGRGIASAVIASFASRLREQGCDCVFLGAMVGERACHLYAALGFRPVMLTRCWVRQV